MPESNHIEFNLEADISVASKQCRQLVDLVKKDSTATRNETILALALEMLILLIDRNAVELRTGSTVVVSEVRRGPLTPGPRDNDR